MDNRSPLESIFSIVSGHDKPVKHAVYNAVAIFVLLLCLAAGWALYIILEPFIKPLMWALLVGSVLHPLKRSLRERFQAWFENLQQSNTPVIFGLVLVPFNIMNDFSELIGSSLLQRLKVIIIVCILIPLIHVLYYYTPSIISTITWNLCTTGIAVLNVFLNFSSVVTVLLVLIAYLSVTFILWKPENDTKFHYSSIGVWLLISCCVAHQFGSFQMLIFMLLQVIFFGGFVSEVYEMYKEMNNSGHPISLTESLSLAFHDNNLQDKEESSEEIQDNDTNIIQDENSRNDSGDKIEVVDATRNTAKDPWSLELFDEKSNDSKNLNMLSKKKDSYFTQKHPDLTNILKPSLKSKQSNFKRSLSQPQFYTSPYIRSKILNIKRKLSLENSNQNLMDPDKYGSTFYLYSLLWACCVMLFWKHTILLPLLPVPILFYIIKHLGLYLGFWGWIYSYCSIGASNVKLWCQERHNALVPVPIRGLYRVIHKVNVALKDSISQSIDTVASSVVILGLIIFLTVSSVFIVLQIYAEGIMMIQMTSNVINQTVVHNPELQQLLPPAWDDTMNSILDNAYQYGREGISKAIKGMMSDAEKVKSEKLEQQVLELWDRVYQNWMSSNDVSGPKVTSEAVKTTWEAFLNDIQKSPEMFNLSGLMEFGKQNVGTLMSLLESVWLIVKSNTSLVVGSFSALLSIILGGGTAVLNFILNVVVFLTTLFYLLSSSGNLYKPVEIMTNFSRSSSRFGHALEAAINGVFTASFKMAVFYGLWTWFIHNLFGVKIVYLPSAFAMILGAVPFLGTYWACIPAVLDLWLAQDRGLEAILIAAFQFLPTSVVDTTIYNEIKGGHPYLTGLAIAGGIFCLGVEGAIIGPLLLCGLYVAIDLSSNLFRESPSEESLNIRLQLQQNS